MKLLLTSAGITNTSLRVALLELLGRPIAGCRALLISTASYPLRGGPELAWNYPLHPCAANTRRMPCP